MNASKARLRTLDYPDELYATRDVMPYRRGAMQFV